MSSKKSSRFLSAVLALVLVVGLMPTAFANTEMTPADEGSALAVSIEEDRLTLTLGDNETLTASVSPDANASISWSSDDTSVATVANGRVTAVGVGTATIRASAGESEDSCDITVEAPAEPKVTGISIDPGTLALAAGESDTLTADVTADDGAEYTVTWRSSDNSVATVEDGTVTAVAQGSATITAQAGNETATCRVTVSKRESSTVSITVAPSKLSLVVGESNSLAVATIPSGQSVTWASSDRSIATVADGKVTAIAKGSATITATITVDGTDYTASCAVTVTEVTGKPAISKTTLSLAVKASETLSVSNVPSGSSVSWKSGKTSVATVDSNGKVTAVAAGTAVITVTVDGTDLTCTVTVSAAALNKSSLTVAVKKTGSLSVSDLPSGATVSWKSSKTSVATVKASGTGNVNCTVTGVAKGSATITATVTYADKSTKSLTCTVTVTSGAADVTYSVSAGEAVVFSRSDFSNVCSDVNGYSLNYIKFSSSSVSKGLLCYNYDDGDYDSKISTSTSYYYTGSSSKSYLSKVAFLADSGSSGTSTISYTGYDSKGSSYTGSIVITIKASSGDVEYSGDRNEVIAFDDSDFNSYCKKETGSSSALDYVRFTLPSSSRGTLYYKYGETGQKKVTASTSYYYSESPYLEDISFVPASNWSGTVSINFTGRNSKNTSFSGTVEITIDKTSDTISYSVDKNDSVSFSDTDFNTYCKDETGATLDYVKFTLPSSSQGVLYYKYDESGEKKASASTSYYRSGSPYLDDITFVPANNYTGTVSIKFSGKSTDNDSFSGTLKVYVGTDSSSDDITYPAAVGSAVTFDDSDFNTYCKDETGATLDYVKFTLPSSSKGILYYKYDESGEKKATASTSYYRSKSPYLEDVTFVPAKSVTSNVSIDFSGKSTDGDTFSGTVVIQYGSSKEPSVIRYTTGYAPVVFRTQDFSNACNARGGAALSSVKFTLPAASVGHLYYNYTSPTSYGGAVSSSTAYTTASGSNNISTVTFLPKAGYSGTATIAYVGTDKNGATFTGNVQVVVTPPSASSHFTDMGASGWSAPAVDFLYESKVTTGTSTTTYSPTGQITRGDFVLMLARAFSFTNYGGTDNFSDVPAGSYYAQAIASAKAMGIAQGSGDKFRPTAALTREDAMVLLQRTLNRTGRTIPDASGSYLDYFSDGASVSSYAQSAVAALIQAGIIQGDDTGKINPKGSLTRAEMAIILHRVLTL